MLGKTAFSWPRLAIALLAGIGAWLLFGLWHVRAPVDAAKFEAMNSQTRLNTESMQQTLSDELTSQARNDQQERMESPLGLALFRKCSEWTDFNDNQPSAFARENEKNACAEFRRYIETGDVLE